MRRDEYYESIEEVLDMSRYTEQVTRIIEQMEYNSIFVASELKKSSLSELPEAIYYKALERMVQQGKLVHLTKGLYYRPCIENNQVIPITKDAIVDYYVADNKGVLIGEGVLIEKGIALGAERRMKILSNRLLENKKNIGNISIEKTDLELNDDTIAVVQTLEILQSFESASQLDKKRFIAHMRSFAQEYSEEATEYVLSRRKYKKATIAFLKVLLDWFGIYNSLNEHLSPLSKYKIPTIEELRLEIPEYVQLKLKEYVARIRSIYGTSLEEVILYGSYAKGNFDEADSDIDIMILLNSTEEEIAELGNLLTDLSYSFLEDYELDVKPMAISKEHFLKWVGVYPFYESVRRDGVSLYGVA